MKFVQDIIIFVAKILIFIGDIVLIIFGFFTNLIKQFLQFFHASKNKVIADFYRIKKSPTNKVVEREIYSSENNNFSNISFKKPQIKLETPKINIPEFHFQFNFPKFSFPKFHLPKIAFPKFKIEIPQIKLPNIKITTFEVKIPKVSFNNIELPRPTLPFFHAKPKKRGRKKKNIFVKFYNKRVKTIRLPSISLPRVSLPKITLPTFSIPKPNLPNLHIRHKKRGRKRKLPIVVPFGTRFKYLFIGTTFSFVFFFMPLAGVMFINSLPNPHTLKEQEIAQTTKIYDRNKVLLYQIYANQNRTSVPLNDIPKSLQEATIAIEDKNFYTTPGFDIKGIARSAYADITGKPIQGGSTITQQLIKTRLLSPERTLERKAKELVLAVWAEQIYSKNEILEMYLNQVPYGGTAWGAEAASQTYFGKSVKKLNLAESAFLAGLPQAPSSYSPHQNDGLWKNRQKQVLDEMVDAKFITRKEADDALKTKLTFNPPEQSIKAPHFVMYVKNLLVEKYGINMVERGGLNVITTLDVKTQDMAQEIITKEVENGSYLNFSNGAALITNPNNGDILAMVGGKDYYEEQNGNYNVTTALRQPGSTIKVVTYAAALMNGYTAATPISDTPVTYASNGAPSYSPVNYDGRFRGNITLRNALGNSINIPAVKTLNQVGIPTMMNLAHNMGIDSWKDPENYGLAITLGAAEAKMTEMATVYGTLANEGNKVDLNPIIKVSNYQGAVLEEKKVIRPKRALSEEVAYIISNILADNSARAMEFGLNSPLNIPGHTVSVKTGTTDNKRDNWTIGYTPNILVAVWVGNNNNAPMNPVLASGITGAAPIWNKIMNNLLKDSKPTDEVYQTPLNIVARSCGGKNEYFVKGTENRGFCRPISLNEKPLEQKRP